MEKEIKLYHFFAWSNHNGWQHLGLIDGYETYEECHMDNRFHIQGDNKRDKFKIMKLNDVFVSDVVKCKECGKEVNHNEELTHPEYCSQDCWDNKFANVSSPENSQQIKKLGKANG